MKVTRQHIIEMLRFGVVGVVATVIHYAIYYILLPYMNENIAYSIGFFISWLCNFVMSSMFTFRVRMTWMRLFRFAGSHVGNYLVQMALLNFWLWVGVPSKLVPLPVYAISVPVSYLLVRLALISRGTSSRS